MTRNFLQRGRRIQRATFVCGVGLVALASVRAAYAADDIRISGAADEKRIKGKSTIYYSIPADTEMTARFAGPATVTLKLANHRISKRGPPSVVAITIDGQSYAEVRLPCRPTPRRFSVGRAQPCKPITNVIVLEKGEHTIGFRIVQSKHGASVQISVDTASAAAQAGQEDLTTLDLVAIEDIWDEKPADDKGSAARKAPDSSNLTPTAAAATETMSAGLGVHASTPSPLGRALRNPITWVAVGVGVVATGIAIYFGSDSQQRYNSVMQNRPIQVRAERSLSKARTSALIANVLFGVAGVAGIAGGLLFYFDLSLEPAVTEAGAGHEGATEATTWKLGVSFPF